MGETNKPISWNRQIELWVCDLILAGKTIEHYSDPRMKPLSKKDFLMLEFAYKDEYNITAKIKKALSDHGVILESPYQG